MKNKFIIKLELIKDKYNDRIILKTENRNNKYKKRQEENEQKIIEMKVNYNQKFDMLKSRLDEIIMRTISSSIKKTNAIK